jgi:peptidoglycan hydrolase-like protein with peptidoglycan-binding domain
MPRVVYGPGAHGGVVESLQRALVAAKFDTKGVDGFYGNNTKLAVQAFQNANPPLESTGIVDDATWQKLMQSPIPPIDVRTLELTAAFEGHGYTLAQGNWDGAWLTWGIIGFTMIHQEVQKIVLAVETGAPALIRTAFGDNAGKLLEVMNDTPRNQQQWANSISNGSRVVEPWLTGFRLLGQFPQVQQIQRQAARDHYFIPATATARKFKLGSELGLALCFDIHVQNGIGADAQADIGDAVKAAPPADERALRVIIADAVADNARSDFREDVRKRKLAIARGQGIVHGANYVLENWGLIDSQADPG